MHALDVMTEQRPNGHNRAAAGGNPSPAVAPGNTVKLTRHEDGRLVLHAADAETTVHPTRCFPWSSPTSHISLRDDDGGEMLFVADASELDDESRACLEIALAECGFVLRITRILSVKEEFEIRAWSVETDRGPRRFQTARDEWPRDVPGDGLLIRDVAGDLFHIVSPESLDEESQKILWAFVD